MLKKCLWVASTLVTLLFILLFSAKLYYTNKNYNPDSEQLVNNEAVGQYFKTLGFDKNQKDLIYIPTGIFLESISLPDSYDVVTVSGYIWQRYDDSLPTTLSRGLLFPDSADVKFNPIYTAKEGNSTVLGWSFEAKLPQTFDYTAYPLDHKIVKIRMWHNSFGQNSFGHKVVLTPDLNAYFSTHANDKFGLDQDVFLQGYTPLETFFRYDIRPYDTNFGIPSYLSSAPLPELSFNIALKRSVFNVFVINVMPLLAVLLLLYGALLMITTLPDDISSFGFKLAGILRVCAVCLFIILLAHGQMRLSFKGSDIVYMEYLYFILYLATFYLGINAFLILKSLNHDRRIALLYYGDNLLAKVLFLPLIFGLVLAVTYWRFGF